MYAALVATGALWAVVDGLDDVPKTSVASVLREAIKTRANPAILNRALPASAVVTAASKLNLVPDTTSYNSVESWVELAGSQAFGGQGLRDLQSWVMTQYGTCSEPHCLRNRVGSIVIRSTCLFLSATARARNLNILISNALTNNFVCNGKCGLAWKSQTKGAFVECKGRVYRKPSDPFAPTIDSTPEILWVAPLFSAERCASLETYNGKVFVSRNLDEEAVGYKLVGATYLSAGHYVSFVRFGEKWFYISSCILRPTEFDATFIPVRIKFEREEADLKMLVFVKLHPEREELAASSPELTAGAPPSPPYVPSTPLPPWSPPPEAEPAQLTATVPQATWALPDIQPGAGVRHFVPPIPRGPDSALIFSNNMCHLLQGWFEPVYAVAEHLGIVNSCISEQPRSLFHRALQNCLEIRKRAHSATEQERWLAPLQLWQAALRRERKEVPLVASFGQMGSCIPWYRVLAVDDLVGSFLHAAFHIETVRKGQCTTSWCIQNYEVTEATSSLPATSSHSCNLLVGKLQELEADPGLRLSCVGCGQGTSGFRTQVTGLGEAVVVVVEERLLAEKFTWKGAEDTAFGRYAPIALAVLKSDHYSSRLRIGEVWKNYSYHCREMWPSSTPIAAGEYLQAIIYCRERSK